MPLRNAHCAQNDDKCKNRITIITLMNEIMYEIKHGGTVSYSSVILTRPVNLYTVYIGYSISVTVD